jgi:hypothetical protein
MNFVEFALRVPRLHGVGCRGRSGLDESGFQLADGDAEDARGDLKHAGHHAIDREIRTQRLLVEIVVFLALFLGPVGDFPRFQRPDRLSRFRRLELRELFILREESGLDACMQVLDERESVPAGFSHATKQC